MTQKVGLFTFTPRTSFLSDCGVTATIPHTKKSIEKQTSIEKGNLLYTYILPTLHHYKLKPITMLKNILNRNDVQSLNKTEQSSINGGANSCLRECRQDFVDCREDGHSHCAASLAVCKSMC
ncbi:hypothetical protein [Aquimarina macrocephali]|uniref:hypothetical protein n=1 Tax=Aquimarina macrocephali TaxID=666563 RepID=UPI003F67284C